MLPVGLDTPSALDQRITLETNFQVVRNNLAFYILTIKDTRIQRKKYLKSLSTSLAPTARAGVCPLCLN
jgi:hypothetical protein